MRKSVNKVVLASVVMLAATGPAYAYLDPNSAGLLYQIFFPLIVALTVAWRRIKDVVFLLWTRIRRIRD